MFGTVSLERPVVIPGQAVSIGGKPQITIFSLHTVTKSVGIDAICVALVEQSEAHSIKPNQSIEGGDPDIAIRRLGNAANAVLRQAIVDCPDVVTVLNFAADTLTKQHQEAGTEES